MKTAFLIISLMAQCLIAKSQTASNSIGIGMQTEFPNFNLSDEIGLGNSTVYAFGVIGDHLNLKLGYAMNVAKKMQEKHYESYDALSVGVGFLFNSKKHEHLSTEVALSFSESFQGFGTFSNTISTLEVNWLLFNSFFCGVGGKYAHLDSPILSEEKNAFSFFWHLGFQFGYPLKKQSAVH
ncbi:MAG: hypothetical protein IKI09_10790 [Bacteroidales bacterium]|nr:hypothetical protein [Bacteroidales bacterium]